MALVLKSQRQIQTDILNAIISRLGLTDVNPGSVLDLMTQAVSQEDFNQYVQMSQIVRLVDLDSTTGEDLANRAFEYGLTRNLAVQSNGNVDITRLTAAGDPYTKISTTFVSAGVLAPSAGDTVLNLNSTEFFIAGGGNRIVVGRGLANEEIRNIDARTSVVAGDTTNTLTISPPLALIIPLLKKLPLFRLPVQLVVLILLFQPVLLCQFLLQEPILRLILIHQKIILYLLVMQF